MPNPTPPEACQAVEAAAILAAADYIAGEGDGYLDDDAAEQIVVVLRKTAAELAARPQEVAAPVGDGDFVEHSHPEYGQGYFCTPDVFAKIAASVPVASVAVCQHVFHHFGDQTARRCVNCGQVEATPVPGGADKEPQGPGYCEGLDKTLNWLSGVAGGDVGARQALHATRPAIPSDKVRLEIDLYSSGEKSDPADLLTALHEIATPAASIPAGGEVTEVLGETCIDGGKCHHECAARCFRRECCAPLTASGLTMEQWQYPTQQDAAPAVAGEAVKLVENLVAATHQRDSLHAAYTGKAMPDDVYERFCKLRDETVPKLWRAVHAVLTTPAVVQPTDVKVGEDARLVPVACVYRGGVPAFGKATAFKDWMPGQDSLPDGEHTLYAILASEPAKAGRVGS
jgi:hypothetical protein